MHAIFYSTLNKKLVLIFSLLSTCAFGLSLSAEEAATKASTGSAATSKDLNSVIDKGVQRGDIAKENEKEIANVDKTLKDKQQTYMTLLKENEGLAIYIKQLKKQLENQKTESQKIEQAIVQSAEMERQVVPLMTRMLSSLDELVKLDMPFKKSERLSKLENLRVTLDRSDVSVAEKYRKVLEMYQNEIDYGRTIEAYREELTIEGAVQQVDVLRVGRLALIYQSLDGKRIATWNNEKQVWLELDSAYKSKIQKAIRIAREQAAPELIKVPLTIPNA
jgi:Protein of unknown function (DUF3450)